MSNIDKWSIFCLLKPDFVANIRLAWVFGNGNEAIIATETDEVYAIGSNTKGCLGLGNVTGSFEPRKIESLCKKNIETLAYGTGPHVLASTGTGELLTWGCNEYGQLGNGLISAAAYVPTSISANIQAKNIVKVCCGAHHSLVLTEEGAVYAWGCNNHGQLGSGSTVNQPTPQIVAGVISSRKVVAIACSSFLSIAVLDCGEVYSWGYNGMGNLGIGTKQNEVYPCRVDNLDNVVIRKIACGMHHALALTDKGVLYAWGRNDWGQLGIGTKTDLLKPIRVETDIGRIVEIAATQNNNLSAALSENGKVYVWGQCKGSPILTPTETTSQSIQDVFAFIAKFSETSGPIKCRTSKVNPIVSSLSQAFNDETTSDLKFIVDGKTIFVHKAILKIRCEHFKSMFQEHWDENGKIVLEIDHFTYPVYFAFLQYLYTSEIDISVEDDIGLLELANLYCEMDLKKKCERLIRDEITVENVSMLYSLAIKYQAKELEEYGFRFAVDHLNAVVQTESFATLDDSIAKSFIIKAAQEGVFK